jgi:dTDP-4-amino-4,6-dideoxygalactose transaminase
VILGRRLRPVGEAVPRLDLRGLLSPSTESATSRHEHFLNLPFPGWRTFAYASGTAALAAAITTAIRHKCTARPQVIVPAYACPDVVSAAVFAGARPVLADTLPNSPWLDPAAVADLTTADTVAVVYLRFLGLPANDLSLRAAVGNSGALLIEDCAHFFPTSPCIESSADLLAFSFGRGKPVSVRSGGMLLQRTESSAAFLVPCLTAIKPDTGLARVAHWARCLLYNTCIEPHVYWLLTQLVGARVDAIRWRELRSVEGFRPSLAPLLPEAIERHRRRVAQHQERLASVLRGVAGPWIDLATYVSGKAAGRDTSSVRGSPRLWRYPILLPSEADRDRVFLDFWKQGLGASRLYGATLSELPHVRSLVSSGKETNARDLARRLLALPLHSDVRSSDLERMRTALSRLASRPEFLAAQPLRS